jgi:bifunctional non-homologous end joining protein LigD
MLSSRQAPLADAPFFGPCLPSPTCDPPTGSDWLHEIKFDGYRALIRRDGNGARLFTRRGYDWTSRFPAIARAAEAVRAKSFLIDGEAVWCDENGLPVYEMLGQRQYEPAVFLYAFDLIHLNGRDLRLEPIERRKALLAKLIPRAGYGLQLSNCIEEDVASIFKHACKLGLEGVISKRRGSCYISGRSPDWIKLKNPNSPAVKRETKENCGE